MIRVYYLTIIIIMILSIPQYASGRAIRKKKIAVLPLSVENVSLSLSNITRNALELKFFKSESFLLIEIVNIKRIAREKGIDESKFGTDSKAIAIGKALKADFVICGSIEKIEVYKMIVKLISIESGEILTAYSKNFDKDIELYDVSEKISQNIERDIEIFIKKGYVKKRNYDYNNLYFSLNFNYSLPLGIYKKLVYPSLGFHMDLFVDNILYDNFITGLVVGYSDYNGKENCDDEIKFAYIQAHLGHLLYLNKIFFIKPYINGGPNLVIIKHGYGSGFNMDDNSEHQSVEPYVSLGLTFNFIPVTDNIITIGTEYSAVVEISDLINTFQFYLGYSKIF